MILRYLKGRVRHQRFLAMLLLLSMGIHAGIAAADIAATATFNIPAQPVQSAIRMYTEQSGVQITSAAELLKGRQSNGVTGALTARAALTQLLLGTDIEYDIVDANTVALRLAATSRKGSGIESVPGSKRALRLAQTENRKTNADAVVASDSAELEEIGVGIPEILVTGSKILNTDIRRTRDDVQPYVIFNRETIERSGALNLEQFLSQRLPMNVAARMYSQNPRNGLGNASRIDLRGLGTNQTLILVDGRRLPSITNFGNPFQPDINGIPLAAIERIEILPTTASGIYGGGATGGAINIIKRRDYAGGEIKLSYDNTFDTDSAIRMIDLAVGFNLEGGKTNVLLAASRSDQNELLIRDRDFNYQGRLRHFANNPALFLPPNAPPLGATTNIRSTDGSDLVLKDNTPLNSQITFVPYSYAGPGTDAGAALVANAGQYNFDLPRSAQSNVGGLGPIVVPATIESFTATLRRELGARVQAVIEAAGSKNDGGLNGSCFDCLVGRTFTLAADAPNNPFQQAIQVTAPIVNPEYDNTGFYISTEDRRLVGGVIVKLPKQWQAQADYTWGRTELRNDILGRLLTPAGGTAISSGALDVLRDLDRYPLDVTSYLGPSGPSLSDSGSQQVTLENATLRFAGPVLALPAGALSLSLLLETRDEHFDDITSISCSPDCSTSFRPSRSQSVKSGYLELHAPLVSSRQKIPGIHQLALQIAARHDVYTIHGVTPTINWSGITPPSPFPAIERATNEVSSTDPTVGLSWKPVEDLQLRASFGTGFLPPTVNQVLPRVFPIPVGQNITLTDPQRGNTLVGSEVGYQEVASGHPNLTPEESKSWSAGMILTPRFAPGLRLSVDYTRIKKTDNIAFLPFGLQVLIDNESVYAGRVVRGPKLPTDPADWAGPIVVLDRSLINIARTDVEAYDIQLDYRLDTARGRVDFFMVGTLQTHLETQTLPSQPLVETVGFNSPASASSSSPLKLKANAGLTWTYEGWTVGWNTRYFDSYRAHDAFTATDPDAQARAILNQGADHIPSQIYHDAFAGFRFDAAGSRSWKSRLLENTELQLRIKNVFNTEPPFDAFGIDAGGAGYYSNYGDPRLASYYLSVRKSFD